jgi:Type II CAAX prenyl endopeptidase Rce1-like
MALTKSAPAGILLSGATFGIAHAYQGFRMVILISLYGAMFGMLAHWRGSVRPGMIAHAWQDSLNGVLASMTRLSYDTRPHPCANHSPEERPRVDLNANVGTTFGYAHWFVPTVFVGWILTTLKKDGSEVL